MSQLNCCSSSRCAGRSLSGKSSETSHGTRFARLSVVACIVSFMTMGVLVEGAAVTIEARSGALDGNATGPGGQVGEVPYDYFVLFPLPKIMNAQDGWISLEDTSIEDSVNAKNTRTLLEQELRERYGFSFSKEAKERVEIYLLGDARCQDKLSTLGLSGKLKYEQDDGFILSVRKDGILIAAPNNRGIYYAVRSLLQLIDHDTAPGTKPVVKCRDIVDWPDQKFRGFFTAALGPTKAMQRIKPPAKSDIKFFEKYIYNSIAGARYNAIVFEMDNTYRYMSHPEIAMANALSKDDMQEIIAFCRDNYLEPIPMVDSPGHAAWLLDRHPEWADLNSTTVCTRDPHAMQAMKEIFQELIDLFGGSGRVKFFHVGADEVRWTTFDSTNRKLRTENSYTKGVPYNELFLEYIRFEHDFFSSKGIRLMMWADMLTKDHNGKKYQTTDIAAKLPKDIILVPWSGEYDYPSIPLWLEEGFTVIKSCTGYQHNAIADDGVSGYMFNNFTTSVWLSFVQGSELSSHQAYFNISVLKYADLAWNNDSSVTNRDEGDMKRIEFMKGYGNALNFHFSNSPFMNESNEFKTIDLGGKANALLENSFGAGPDYDLHAYKQGPISIAGIDMLIDARCLVLDQGVKRIEGVRIASPAASLVFLHTAYLPADKEASFRERIRTRAEFAEMPKFNPVGFYRVNYVDGTREIIPLQFGLNIGTLRPSIQLRFLYGTRFTLAPPGVWTEAMTGRDVFPGAPALYQLEWINPHPEKAIDSLDFVSLETEVIPALVALAVRTPKSPTED